MHRTVALRGVEYQDAGSPGKAQFDDAAVAIIRVGIRGASRQRSSVWAQDARRGRQAAPARCSRNAPLTLKGRVDLIRRGLDGPTGGRAASLLGHVGALV
jgi:hypothetical protein